MKVKDVREILESALAQMKEYSDDAEISMVSNTYFLNGASAFLGISGYNGGYIDLENMNIEEIEDEDEDTKEE